MPAKSKAQQKAAGAALSAKRGKRGKSSLKGASKGMYESMGEGKLREMAKGSRKGKPQRAAKKKSTKKKATKKKATRKKSRRKSS
jgi:hypothetical protein